MNIGGTGEQDYANLMALKKAVYWSVYKACMAVVFSCVAIASAVAFAVYGVSFLMRVSNRG